MKILRTTEEEQNTKCVKNKKNTQNIVKIIHKKYKSIQKYD